MMMDLQTYSTRRSKFVEELEHATNLTLRSRIEAAISASDMAANVFVELAPAASSFANRYKLRLDSHSNEASELVNGLREEFNQAIKNCETAGDETEVQLARTNLLLLTNRTTTNRQLFSYDILSLEVSYLVFISTIKLLSFSLFDEIYKPDRDDFKKAAVTKTLSFIAGLTPVGPLLDGVQKAIELFQHESTKVKSANSYLEPTLSSPTREKFDIVDRPHPQTSVGF
jgi:hypothetical protein